MTMPRRATEEIWSAEPLSHCKQGGQCRGRRTVSTGVAAGRDRQPVNSERKHMTAQQKADRLQDRQHARTVLIQRREDLERKIARVEAEIKALKDERALSEGERA